MEEKEYSNIYAIPANYTDSGKLLGGMFETRNTVEAFLLVLLLGYPEVFLLPVSATVRIVIMTVTLIPLAVVAVMGIDGDSLVQYAGHMIRYLINKRKLHFRRVGYIYDQNQLKRKDKDKTGKAFVCTGFPACK